ncbi:hypothetical protein KAW44_01845 [Candidatus Bipolaricaulota bacterium]|nr:hypothetical protein [Candidatus Bipolaricaulota bacterium]
MTTFAASYSRSKLRGIQPAEIEVHRKLGPGLLESTYEQRL